MSHDDKSAADQPITNAGKSASRVSLEVLGPYVPVLVRERLARDPAPLTRPVMEHFPAAVLFADISGFTPLAEELAAQGAAGAERLKEILDICFGKLVELAAAFGGDVIKFPGDGALVLWRARQEADEDLARAVRLASKCGLQIQEHLDGLAAHSPREGEPIRLRLRVAVGAGATFAASVGGSEDRWEFVVGGASLGQIAAALRRASPGEVVCSPEAWTLLEARTAKTAGQGVRIIQEIEPAFPPPVVECPELPQEAGAALRQYIPRLLQARVDAGQSQWLAEFRQVTVLFVNVPKAELAPGGSPDLLQSIASILQRAAHRFGGGVNEIVVDDKGLTFVAGWGQSLSTHDDDAARACQAALQAQRELREAGVECGMGLSSGTAFVGIRGGARRCEYAMIGDVVNLAARLMSAAPGAILCDAATRVRSRRRMTFESLPPVRLKGKAEAVAIFRPLSARARHQAGRQPGRPPLFGREQEQRQLFERLDALAQRREGGAAVIMGDAGIGKSRMIADLLERTQTSTVRGLVGLAEDLERSSPYYAWRSILGAGAQFDLADGEVTRMLTAEARAERTRQTLLSHLQATLGDSPAMIVLEDAHWLDSASWALAEAVSRAIPNVLLVIACRPLAREHMPAELRRMVEKPATLKITLGTLSPADAMSLLSHCLDADSVPESVARLIQEKAEGHPFFIEQLASSLRDHGVIRVVDGDCLLAADERSLSSTQFPETMQAVIRGRIDRLTPEQQMTLKVASVLGRTSRIQEMERIHPLHPDAASLVQQLEAGVDLDLLRPAADEADSYNFKHAITQEVVYGMLPFAQRRQLHRAVAEWLEQRDGASANYALLAHHWSETEDAARSLEYLEKAGERALAAFANREAVNFFSQALAVARTLGDNADTSLRQAHLHRQIGEALFLMGDTKGSFQEAEQSLSVLGHPVPASTSAGLRMLAAQAATQAAHLLFPGRFVVRDPTRRARLAEAAEAAGRYAWIKIIRQDSLGLLAVSLASVNWAQNAGERSVLPLVIVGYTLASLKLQRAASRYFALARANAMELQQFDQLAWAAVMECQNYLGRGELAHCRELLDEVLPLVQGTGDRHATAMLSNVQGIVSTYSGGFAQTSQRIQFALGLLGDEPSNNKPYAIYMAALTEFLILPPRQARASIDEHLKRAREMAAPEERLLPMYLAKLEAALCVRAEDWPNASAAIERAASYGVKASAPAASRHALLFEAYAGYWEHLLASTGHEAAIAELSKACQRDSKAFGFFAWLYPLHQPAHLLFKGQIAWFRGKRGEAVKLWKQGVERAQALSTPYEEALCHYEIGRRSAPQSAAREMHLQSARGLFAQCQASFYLNKTEALLAGGKADGHAAGVQ